MLLIGEKLNSSIPATKIAVNNLDSDIIIDLITKQSEAGAEYLDINAALCENETDKLIWLIDLVTEKSKCGIMLDSPSADAVAAVADYASKRPLILNSVTVTERMDKLAPLAVKHNSGIVLLPIVGNAVPQTAGERLENIKIGIEKLRSYGINDRQIYVDALVESIASAEDSTPAMVTLKTLKLMKTEFPKVKTTCGLSNISFGLPKRHLINSTFLTMAFVFGLDSVIIDPCSPSIKSAIHACNALLGEDEYCIDYIRYTREIEK